MKTRTFAILGALAVSVAAVAAACGGESLPSDTTSSSTTTGDSTTTSSGTTTTSTTSGMGGGGTGGAPDCYTNPMTHVEIINACTDAQQIDINPVLPLLEADGGLPPLP